MFKKLLLLPTIVVCANLQAIQLKNGSYLPKKHVDEIYEKLVIINGEEDKNKLTLLVDLYQACKLYKNKLKRENFFNASFGKNNFDERYDFAFALNLCDKDGNIDNTIAQVILSSISCSLKSPKAGPASFELKSPVSIWHYLNFDFTDDDLVI